MPSVLQNLSGNVFEYAEQNSWAVSNSSQKGPQQVQNSGQYFGKTPERRPTQTWKEMAVRTVAHQRKLRF